MRRGLILVLVLVGACGVPSSDGASTAVGSEVPFGLLDRQETTTTTLPELASEQVSIWLVADVGILAVGREVVAPATLERALGALAHGPTPGEAAFGLRSAVSDDSVADVTLRVGVATIDLEEAFAALTPREQLLALAQLVYTSTEVEGVEVVTFTLGGQSIDVPRGDGSISEGAVTRRDYAELRADRSVPVA